jgi:hypothetical protein
MDPGGDPAVEDAEFLLFCIQARRSIRSLLFVFPVLPAGNGLLLLNNRGRALPTARAKPLELVSKPNKAPAHPEVAAAPIRQDR